MLIEIEEGLSVDLDKIVCLYRNDKYNPDNENSFAGTMYVIGSSYDYGITMRNKETFDKLWKHLVSHTIDEEMRR